MFIYDMTSHFNRLPAACTVLRNTGVYGDTNAPPTCIEFDRVVTRKPGRFIHFYCDRKPQDLETFLSNRSFVVSIQKIPSSVLNKRLWLDCMDREVIESVSSLRFLVPCPHGTIKCCSESRWSLSPVHLSL